jgi:hypothetical protein
VAITVSFTDDPARILRMAQVFLASDPVLHNVILTLLHARAEHGEPGRYWVALDGGMAAGVVFQSPLDYMAAITPMAPDVVGAMVEAIADAGIALPGVSGEAATAARFAGQWTERHRSAAVPLEGQRIYEVRDVQVQTAASGRMRQAVAADRDLLVDWMRRFGQETGDHGGDPAVAVDRRLPAGQFWLWEDGEPVSMAAHSLAVEGVVRVQAVYTPAEKRNHGYGGACVGALSGHLRDAGYRCILYTDLGNPISNLIYRRLGYRAVAECLVYRFT